MRTGTQKNLLPKKSKSLPENIYMEMNKSLKLQFPLGIKQEEAEVVFAIHTGGNSHICYNIEN